MIFNWYSWVQLMNNILQEWSKSRLLHASSQVSIVIILDVGEGLGSWLPAAESKSIVALVSGGSNGWNISIALILLNYILNSLIINFMTFLGSCEVNQTEGFTLRARPFEKQLSSELKLSINNVVTREINRREPSSNIINNTNHSSTTKSVQLNTISHQSPQHKSLEIIW